MRGLTLQITNKTSGTLNVSDVPGFAPLAPGETRDLLYTNEVQNSLEYGKLNGYLISGSLASQFVSGTLLNQSPVGRTFTGATPTAAGTPGLVPSAPVVNRGNYLKADGTWSGVTPFSIGAIPESKLTAQGDLLVRGVTTTERLPLGTLGQTLRSGVARPEWRDLSISGTIASRPAPSAYYAGVTYWSTDTSTLTLCHYTGTAWVWGSTGGSGVGFTAGPTGSGADYEGPTAISAAVVAAAASGLPSTVVVILPGSYTGDVTLPANVSLLALGGLGTVSLSGNLTSTALDGFQTLTGLYVEGSLIADAGASTTASIIVTYSTFNPSTAGNPAMDVRDGGWGFQLSDVGLDGSVSNAEALRSGSNKINMDVGRTSFRPGTGSRAILATVQNLTLNLCTLEGVIELLDGGSAANLSLLDSGFRLQSAATAVVVPTTGSGVSFNILGSFFLDGLQPTGTLVNAGGLITSSATQGAFVGGYQTANLPVFLTDGILAYSTDDNRMVVRSGGVWSPLGGGGPWTTVISPTTTGTTNATPTMVVAFTTTADKGHVLELTVSATRTDRGAQAAWKVLATVTNAGGSVTVRDTIQTLTDPATPWVVSLTVAAPDVQVMVTGAALTNIDWVVTGTALVHGT